METRAIQALLVEDSPEERRLIRLELSGIDDPVFSTQEAGRLSDAERVLRNGQTDVVLLDLSLPDADGLKGLIRLCHNFPSLPVVVFTGLNDQEIALQALREGGQDFLVKGQTEPGELKRVLLHAIERKRVDLTLNTSRESVREAQRLETLGRLAGKIAHDFNNILTTIVGFSDLLLEDLQGQPYVEDLLEIKKAGERGAALTSSILAFSRRERPNVEPISVNDTVLGLFGMLKQLLPRTVTLKLELTPNLPCTTANLGQVEQALVNLVVNARDAMPQGGDIKVKTELQTIDDRLRDSVAPLPAGEYIAVLVEDNGYGIEASALERIFEPFFTTKPREAGTGLGLSTVINIVRACGGGIDVESRLHKGTTFSLFFPPTPCEPELLPPVSEIPYQHSASGTLTSVKAQEPPRSDGSLGELSSLSAQQLSEQLKNIYHVVGHDFHEPLRMVNSYLGLLKRRAGDKLDDEQNEFLDYAVDGSRRMQKMLDGVLRYSRINKAPAVSDPVSVTEIAARAMRAFVNQAQIVSWEGELPTVLASAEQVEVLFSELISNALKFADPQTPKVVVRSRQLDDEWVLEVSDNGPGVPSSDTEKCFQLFGRLHGRDEYPGIGIGLAVVRCLAEKYNATISLGHAPGGGGLATLRWPAERVAKP